MTIWNFFLFFPENGVWHFMQIVSLGDNLCETSKPISWFVCVEVLWPSQSNGVMSSMVSLPHHTFTGQALSSKRVTSFVHILSPETDNCPSWISERERMTTKNISWSISMKECCTPSGGRTRNFLITSRQASTWATEADTYFMEKIRKTSWICHLIRVINI